MVDLHQSGSGDTRHALGDSDVLVSTNVIVALLEVEAFHVAVV